MEKTPIKPQKITAILSRKGIEYDSGYFSPGGSLPHSGVRFTAWKDGKVVAVLFRAEGEKDWVIEK